MIDLKAFEVPNCRVLMLSAMRTMIRRERGGRKQRASRLMRGKRCAGIGRSRIPHVVVQDGACGADQTEDCVKARWMKFWEM